MENEKNTEFDPFNEDDFLNEDAKDEGEDEVKDGDADEDAPVDEGAKAQGTEDPDDGAESAEEDGAQAPSRGVDFAARAEADAAEIAKAYPGLGVKSLAELKNLKRYGELRDKGMTAVEAFRATNADLLTANAERIGAGRATGKAHLQSVARKAGARAASQMTNAERQAAREFFGDEMSDKELERLHARATK